MPVGYPCYTAVLHPLAHPGDGRPVRWLEDNGHEPWDDVREIYRRGLGGFGASGRFVADNPLWHRPSAQALCDALLIMPDDSLYTSAFFPSAADPVVTMTGQALRARLGEQRGRTNGVWGPTV